MGLSGHGALPPSPSSRDSNEAPPSPAPKVEAGMPGSDAFAADGTVDPFVSLKDYTSERQDEAAAILQEWLNEDRKVAVNE